MMATEPMGDALTEQVTALKQQESLRQNGHLYCCKPNPTRALQSLKSLSL